MSSSDSTPVDEVKQDVGFGWKILKEGNAGACLLLTRWLPPNLPKRLKLLFRYHASCVPYWDHRCPFLLMVENRWMALVVLVVYVKGLWPGARNDCTVGNEGMTPINHPRESLVHSHIPY